MINLHLDIDIKTLPLSEAHKKIDGINQVGNHFFQIKSYTECKYCCENALEMAEKINYDKGIAMSKFTLGVCYSNQSDFVSAIPLIEESLKMFNYIGDLIGEATAYKDIGFCYWRVGDYKAQIDAFFKALNIYRKLNDENREAGILNSIGNYYMVVSEHNLSLEYYKMSLTLSQKYRDITMCIMTLFNMASVYVNTGQLVKSLKYFNTALEFNTRIEQNLFFKIRITNNIATIYSDMGDYEKAEKIHLECADYFLKEGNDIDRCDVLINMACNYRVMKNFEKAEKVFTEACALSEKLNSDSMMITSYREFSKYYLDQKDFKNALLYHKKFVAPEFEMNKSLQENNIRKLSVLHKVDITKKETEALSKKNEDLKSINVELSKLNEEKNYFLNLAANDLKTPLENITDKISCIKLADKTEHTKHLSEILIESSYMQKVISDLLTINELDTVQ